MSPGFSTCLSAPRVTLGTGWGRGLLQSTQLPCFDLPAGPPTCQMGGFVERIPLLRKSTGRQTLSSSSCVSCPQDQPRRQCTLRAVVGDTSPGLKPGPEGRQGLGTGPPGTSGPQAMLLTKHSRPEAEPRPHMSDGPAGRAQVAHSASRRDVAQRFSEPTCDSLHRGTHSLPRF